MNTENLTDHQRDVLDFIRANPGTRLDVRQGLAAQPLIRAGLIRRVEVVPHSTYKAATA